MTRLLTAIIFALLASAAGAQVTSDNFTSIGTGTLAGRTASGGGTWVDRDGGGSSTVLSGNGSDKVTCPSSCGTRAGYYLNVAPAGANYTVAAVITITSTGKQSIGPACRMQTGSNTQYWAMWSGGNGWQLWKRSGGSDTQLGSTVNSDAPTSAKTATISCNGSTISLDVSGASNPLISASDSSITTAGYGGLFNYFSDATLSTADDLVVTDISAPGPTSGRTIRVTQ